MLIHMLRRDVPQLVMWVLLGFSLGLAVVEWPGVMLMLVAFGVVSYGLHRVITDHRDHARVLERDRHKGPLAYLRWFLAG
jgi:hypothetical protein